ncbi:MAG: tetratricopeptide repeat protein, partial [Planctomycetota bacterium]
MMHRYSSFSSLVGGAVRTLILGGSLALTGLGSTLAQDVLAEEVVALAEETLRQPIEAHRPKGLEADLYERAMATGGDLAPLLDYLDARAEEAEEAGWRFNAARLAAHLLWRFGDLEHAKLRFEALLSDAPEDLDVRLSLARLLDALGRSKEALEAYEALAPSIDDETVLGRVQ